MCFMQWLQQTWSQETTLSFIWSMELYAWSEYNGICPGSKDNKNSPYCRRVFMVLVKPLLSINVKACIMRDRMVGISYTHFSSSRAAAVSSSARTSAAATGSRLAVRWVVDVSRWSSRRFDACVHPVTPGSDTKNLWHCVEGRGVARQRRTDLGDVLVKFRSSFFSTSAQL